MGAGDGLEAVVGSLCRAAAGKGVKKQSPGNKQCVCVGGGGGCAPTLGMLGPVWASEL